MNEMENRCVLIDRDGVINRRIAHGYVTRWEEFSFLPGVLDGLRLFHEHGYRVLVISSQACVGRGLLSWNDLQAITRRMRLEVALAGGNICGVYYCPHLPEGNCACRKPEPGLLIRAMREHDAWPSRTHMIGDSWSDLEAAARAGCPAIGIRRTEFLLGEPAERHSPWTLVSNLREAAECILLRDTPTLADTLRLTGPLWPFLAPLPVSHSSPMKRNLA